MTLPSGTCFGFAITSARQIPFLRGGGGDPLLIETTAGPAPDLGPIITRWTPNDRNPIAAVLHSGPDGGYRLRVEEDGWYSIDPEEGRISCPPGYHSIAGAIRLLGLPLLLLCLSRGDSTLHAATVEVNGRAIVLAAPGRHGKTSLAATFVNHGHRLLTEDLTCLRLGDSMAVVPGPTGLRVRQDMTDVLPVSGYRQIGTYQDRLVLAPVSDAGDCSPVPLAGVVMVADFEDRTSLMELDPAQAVPNLWYLSFHLPSDDERARKFQALVDLVASVPVWELRRPPGPALLDATVETIIEAVSP